jgi:hypothetical protein
MDIGDSAHDRIAKLQQASTLGGAANSRGTEARSWTAPGTGAEAVHPHAWVPVAGGGPRAAYDFVAKDGRRLSISLTGEPVFDLRRAQPVATYVRVRTRVLADRDGQPAPADHRAAADDAERLERLEFRRGLALLQESGAELGMAPVSWDMAAGRQSAFAALNTGVRGAASPRAHLIAELTGVPAGVSKTLLRQVVAFVAERRRAVFARLSPDTAALAAIAGSGVRGVCFAMDEAPLQTDAGWRRLQTLIRNALMVVPTVVIDRVPAQRHDELLDAGATHAIFARFTAPLV